MNATDYPHGLIEIEDSLCCAEPRTGLDSCNNVIALDLRCVSSLLLERSDPELSTVSAKTCSLILGCGNQVTMVTMLETREATWKAERKSRCSAEKKGPCLIPQNLMLWILAHKLLLSCHCENKKKVIHIISMPAWETARRTGRNCFSLITTAVYNTTVLCFFSVTISE